MRSVAIPAKLGAWGVCLLLGLLPAGALSSEDLIQPGVRVNDACTLNFVYDGIGVNAGRVYIGTAAHCVDGVGQSMSTAEHPDFGRVAYRGAGHPEATDFAFIEVHPQFVPFVSPEVKGHPGQPTGTTVSPETEQGDVLWFSGHGMGFHATAATRENRAGVLESDDTEEWLAYAPILPGDSGGPVLHLSGEALGIVTAIHVSYGTAAPPFAGATGPTLEGVLARAATEGFPVVLRTA